MMLQALLYKSSSDGSGLHLRIAALLRILPTLPRAADRFDLTTSGTPRPSIMTFREARPSPRGLVGESMGEGAPARLGGLLRLLVLVLVLLLLLLLRLVTKKKKKRHNNICGPRRGPRRGPRPRRRRLAPKYCGLLFRRWDKLNIRKTRGLAKYCGFEFRCWNKKPLKDKRACNILWMFISTWK